MGRCDVFEMDSFYNMLGDVENAINKKLVELHKKVKPVRYDIFYKTDAIYKHTFAGIVIHFLKSGYSIRRQIVIQARNDLQDILKWLKRGNNYTMSNPNLFHRDNNYLINRLNLLLIDIQKSKDKRTINAPSDWFSSYRKEIFRKRVPKKKKKVA